MNGKASVVAAAIAASGLALSLNIAAAPRPEKGLPAAHADGEVTYLSGGVGQAEAGAIKHVANYYPLELEFLRKATPKDEYLAGVKVRIKDQRERMVLNVTSDGPFLLVKLPAGKYTVSAESNGKIEHRMIEIAAKEHRRVLFEWRS